MMSFFALVISEGQYVESDKINSFVECHCFIVRSLMWPSYTNSVDISWFASLIL